MTNLFVETLEFLQEFGKTFDDIEFVTGNGYEIPVDNFIAVAKSYDYDSGYGGAEVPSDLKVVGKDWWLERAEYDGSEWWEFKTMPKKPNSSKRILAFDRDYSDQPYIYYSDQPQIYREAIRSIDRHACS